MCYAWVVCVFAYANNFWHNRWWFQTIPLINRTGRANRFVKRGGNREAFFLVECTCRLSTVCWFMNEMIFLYYDIIHLYCAYKLYNLALMRLRLIGSSEHHSQIRKLVDTIRTTLHPLTPITSTRLGSVALRQCWQFHTRCPHTQNMIWHHPHCCVNFPPQR